MPRQKKTTKAVAKRKDDSLAIDYGQHGGAGFEDVGGEDLAIPFITILQSNSPQVNDDEPEGSKAGMLYNTVTQDLIDGNEGLLFVPCHQHKAYVEWVPRNDGGGFVALHDYGSKEVSEAISDHGSKFGRIPFNKNEIIETKYFYGLIIDPDSGNVVSFAVISFTSTKLKPFRNALSSMYMVEGRNPLFAFQLRIATTKQKNEHGTFFNFTISPEGGNWSECRLDPAAERDKAILKEAVTFRDMVMSGAAKVDYSKDDNTSSAGEKEDVGF